MKSYKRALTIAGSDSGGGAGIQADLKTFSALGCFGTSVITALTAQNTVTVTGIHPIPPAFIAQQIDAVLTDIGTDAVKIGMLHSPEVITTVADTLHRHQAVNIVLDPVMVAKSGDKLLRDDAVQALKTTLIPLADIITPNLPEAGVLLGRAIMAENQMADACRELAALAAGRFCSRAAISRVPAARISCISTVTRRRCAWMPTGLTRPTPTAPVVP